MQFHHHGYVSGDPRVQPAAGDGREWTPELPDEVDVLIIGGGPAGQIAAAQLAQFPGVTTRLIERSEGRLERGRADGVQARTVETFQAFGFANRIVEEAYRITAMAFWRPDPQDPARIVRASMPADDPNGISEFPHIIVNQARVQDYFAEAMANAPTRMRPDYGSSCSTWRCATTSGEHPVVVEAAPARRHRRRRGARRARQVCARRRQRPQQGARVHRPQARRGAGDARVGGHRRPRRHRLPRHPHQVRDPVPRRRQHPPDPARGRAPVPHVRRPRRGRAGRPWRRAPDVGRRRHRARQPDPPPLRTRREVGGLVQRVRGRAPADRQVRRRGARRTSARARRGSSSPATPVTRTAPRPARA